MKYMKWSDLQPGDVLQFTDEYLDLKDISRFCIQHKNIGLIIDEIKYYKNHMTVSFFNTISTTQWLINYDGSNAGVGNSEVIKFKVIKINEVL